MVLFILKMDEEKAKEICSWNYLEHQNINNISLNEDSIIELLNGSCYAAVNENNELVGFYCYGKSAQVAYGHEFGVYRDANIVDIGLVLRPDLCESEDNLEFVRKCTVLGENLYSSKKFRLTIAATNKKAMSVYKEFGFKEQTSFEAPNRNGRTSFTVMTYIID